jgi:hypothetical protein
VIDDGHIRQGGRVSRDVPREALSRLVRTSCR